MQLKEKTNRHVYDNSCFSLIKFQMINIDDSLELVWWCWL